MIRQLVSSQVFALAREKLDDASTPMRIFLFSMSLFFSSIAAQAEPPRVVFFGDSLTVGYGLSEDEAYPALVEKKFKALGKSIQCVNAGVSGDTTTSALRRLDWILKQKPAYVVIALGANDMLRGISPQATEKNLKEIIKKVKAIQAEPILFGMKALPNLGPRFKKEYEGIFPRLARSEKLKYLDFFLIGVAGIQKMNLPDGIHPNRDGHILISNTVSEFLKKAI